MIEYDPKHEWPVFRPETLPHPLIPKIIHQMWLGANPPLHLIDAWRDKNPSWTHIPWDDNTLNAWRFQNQDKLDLADQEGRAEIMRYEILYHLGGVFIDAQMPAETLIETMFQYDCTTVLEGPGGLLSTKFLASQPRCELMRLCIEGIKVAAPAWWYLGSGYFTETVQTNKYPIKVFPEEKLPPKPIPCRRQGVLSYYGVKIKKPATVLTRSG